MWARGGGALMWMWLLKVSQGSDGPCCHAQEVNSPFSFADLVNRSLNVQTCRPLWSCSRDVLLDMVWCWLLNFEMVGMVNSPSLETDQNVVVMQAAMAASRGLSLFRWLRMLDR